MARREKEYENFAELSQHEIAGVDYRIVLRRVADSNVAVVAPHGGKIEPLTSELARSIAGNDQNFYAFEGSKTANNADLHITSPNFDEPQALSMVESCQHVVTVHGLAGDELEVQVGGLDGDLGERVHANLTKAGFRSKVVTSGEYGGTSASNICNRGKSGAGVQLEIRAGLRRQLCADTDRYAAFVASVRDAIVGI